MGHDRLGRQRWKCAACHVTRVDGAKGLPNRRLPEATEQMIATMLAGGIGVREICRVTGACRHTVSSRRFRGVITPAVENAGPNECDQCGKSLIGENRDCYRNKRRQAGKFCDGECYQAFMRQKRSHDRCACCGKARGEVTSARLTKGFCANCYVRARRFNFDLELMRLDELASQLRKESVHAIRRNNAKRVAGSPARIH